MRRIIAMIGVIVLCAWIVPVQAAGKELSYGRVIGMTEYMRQIASGDYLTIRGAPEDVQRKAREWAAKIDGHPRLVVRMDVEQTGYLMEIRGLFAAEHPMVAYEAESTGLSGLLGYLFACAAAESVVAEAAYEEIIGVNSSLNCEMIYAEEGNNGTGLYVVIDEDAPPILILVTAENGAVSLTGMFLPSGRLARCTNHGQVAMWFLANGFPMTGEQVLPE